MDGGPVRPGAVRRRDFLVLDVATKNCVKGHPGSSDYAQVATLAHETQLELLHLLIETQRLVNALPPAASERAMGLVLDRVQTVTTPTEPPLSSSRETSWSTVRSAA